VCACSTGSWLIILRADFYHLTQVPLDRALPSIAERVVAAGERLAVVADDEALLARLDEMLWTYRADSFLPHGRSGDQPILLCSPEGAESGYGNIALVDGVWREAALGFTRAFYFFDADSVDGARIAWKSLAERDGVERHYWKQEDGGRWQEQG
jgi:DNA polymerase III subunit chi